jgi:hypothetical protein
MSGAKKVKGLNLIYFYPNITFKYNYDGAGEITKLNKPSD